MHGEIFFANTVNRIEHLSFPLLMYLAMMMMMMIGSFLVYLTTLYLLKKLCRFNWQGDFF
jgi:hypothetical protein